MPGPPPKPSNQRRRRNKSWIDRAVTTDKPLRPDEPPRTGKGSTTEAWRVYCTSIGHNVPPGATRGQMIAMVDEGLPNGEEEGWHPLARDWYRSLAESAQSQFYEPSDWQTARVLAELLSRSLRSGRVTAALVERWQVGATELLTTEGARRRARLELERTTEQDGAQEAADVSELDLYRRRRGAS
jgi:hypothetical protein